MLNSQRSINSAGFTLIELVMVILLMGIISVMVVVRLPGTSLNLNYESRRLLNDIRYTQALSLTSGQRYRWVKLSASTYQITNEAGTAITLPSGGTQVTMAAGVTFGTLTNLPNSLIAFNSQGIPYTDSAIPGTALAAAATIPLTGGGSTSTVQITPQTGFGVVL